VGLLAAMAALLLGAVSREELELAKVALLCASSVITAFLAAFALGELCLHVIPLPNPSLPVLSAHV
jgi:solute carrier family 41